MKTPPNFHRITLTGEKIAEITARAIEAFDSFFEGLEWEMTGMSSEAEVMTQKNGAGVTLREDVSSWTVGFEAQIKGAATTGKES